MTSGNYADLIRRFAGNGVLVDSNLLLVWAVGAFSLRLLGKFKRTQAYTEKDFRLLENLLRGFSTVVTMPGILAEVSNLSGQLEGRIRGEFRKRLGVQLQEFREHIEAGRGIAGESAFPRLGYTDAGIIIAARKGFLVLSADLDLCIALQNLELPVINFTHLRRF